MFSNKTPNPSQLGVPLGDLMATIREDLAAHGNDWARPGFRAVAVHRIGAWRMSIASPLVRKPISRVHTALERFVRNVYGIELPYTVELGRRVIVEHQGGIVVHGAAAIGDDSIVRQGVTIGNRRLDRLDDAPRIGRNVNIGAGAVIVGAITVGDGANIGANAVVVRDVPAGATIVAAESGDLARLRAAAREVGP
jgi:serine O-acetyltransferase